MKKTLVIFSLTILFFSCQKKEKVDSSSPIYPVKVAQAIKQDAPFYLEAIGHVESIEKIEVKSRVEGELTGVYFKEGDFVKKGDLLFTIDPRPFQADLKKAQGALQENIANQKLAEEKVVRYTALVQEEYYSEIDFKQLQTNLDTSDASIKQNQADVDSAKLNLDYCWIYSPIDGKTGILQIDKGNMIKALSDEALITINQINPIYVMFSIPEKNLPEVRKYHQKDQKLKVTVSYDDFKTDVFEGELEMINNEVEAQTGMIKMRGLFTNDLCRLWPNLFVRTRLILYVKKEAILIPADAIDYTEEGTYVYVVKADKSVEMRKVELGYRVDDMYVILGGMQASELVVTDGMLNLFQGARVTIKNNESL